MEVSEYLVGSPAFKAGVRRDPAQAGSIPVHLRQLKPGRLQVHPRFAFTHSFVTRTNVLVVH